MTQTYNFTNHILNGKAVMLLNRPIGPDSEDPSTPFIDGSEFANEMYALKARSLNITVKINSPGGRVDHGWSIADAIKSTQADTHIIGLAASMAGICFMFGKKRIADDHATLMIHAPKGGNSTYLGILKSQFSNLLRTISKLPRTLADQLINDGKDHFFDISQMRSYGFIDDVMPTSGDFIKPPSSSVGELYMAYAKHEAKSYNQNNTLMRSDLEKMRDMPELLKSLTAEALEDVIARHKDTVKAREQSTTFGRLSPAELAEIAKTNPNEYERICNEFAVVCYPEAVKKNASKNTAQQ